MLVRWTNHKDIDREEVTKYYEDCVSSRIFTNFGKYATLLQNQLRKELKIDDGKELVMVCNGSVGITALINTFNSLKDKKLRWAVQSFTFPCSVQAGLEDALILDLDEKHMGPDLTELNKRHDEIDGLLLTNCFGHCVNLSKYQKWADKYDKILLLDNAATPLTYYKDKNVSNYGHGSIISLHHTKPIGFGEGGVVIIDKKYHDRLKQIICFGYTSTDRYHFSKYGSNYKMSELNSIYLLSWTKNIRSIYIHHYTMSKLFIFRLPKEVKMMPNLADDVGLCSTLAIVFPKPTAIQPFLDVGIEAKKYYYPLSTETARSIDLFDHIICLPLNLEVNEKIIDLYIQTIIKIVRT